MHVLQGSRRLQMLSRHQCGSSQQTSGVRRELEFTQSVPQAYAIGDSEQAATMAANEAAMHAALQPPQAPAECDQLVKLMGSFSPRAGPAAGEQVRAWRMLAN